MAQVPLAQLLSELTDAKLEKRDADIARLEREVCRRQAQGAPAPERKETAGKPF